MALDARHEWVLFRIVFPTTFTTPVAVKGGRGEGRGAAGPTRMDPVQHAATYHEVPPPGRRRIVEDRNQRATAEWWVHSDDRASFDGDINRAIAEDAPDAGVVYRQTADEHRVRRSDPDRGVHRTGW